ncbi:MAG: ornithine carbamoyltransferase, partial [Succinivibrio sp.]|nr:ornithine carbamoyltransferase [Succinivibrio sp.]
MRHLLTGFEFSQDEYLDILETASAMKKDPAKFRQELAGRSGAIMFEKPSLRTRTT